MEYYRNKSNFGDSMLDPALLKFEKVIIHEIPHPKTNESPTFSEIESDLNEEACNLFRSKIVDTIGNKAYNVIFDTKSKSPIPDQINQLLSDDKDLISISKDIAIHLNSVQNGRNSGGYLTIFVGHIKDIKVVGILKIEQETGGRIQPSEKNGKRTFHIFSFKDIILTKNTRFYKISLFFFDGLKKLGYEGKVCDNQITKKDIIADFFLRKFLGCTFVKDPKTRTKEFYDCTEKYIKEKVVKPSDQLQYHFQLIAYLTNQTREINPEQFATTYLDLKHRDSYIEYLSENGFKKENIKKDLTKIEKDLRYKILTFVNGVEIRATQKKFDEHVTYGELTDGNTKAEVIGKLKKY
jgi:nucleoid-associated protein YejK